MTDLREGEKGLPHGIVQAVNLDPPDSQPRRSPLSEAVARLAEAAADRWEAVLDRLPHRYRIERALGKLNLRRHGQNAWQRARRGYSTEDTFSFDDYLAEVIIGGLTELRSRELAHPMGLQPEEWRAILDEIIIGFKTFQDAEKRFSEDPEVRAKMDRGWELFREWFPALWD